MTARWHVFQVKRAHDRTAAAEIVGRGFPTYLPMEQRERHHNHRIETVFAPRMHPYLFARFDADDPWWSNMLHGEAGARAGIVGILRDPGNPEGVPLWVPDRAMQLVWGYAARPDAPGRKHVYQPGEFVKVYIVPGMPNVGIFDSYQRGRAMVKIWMFGQEKVTPVSADALEPDEERRDRAA